MRKFRSVTLVLLLLPGCTVDKITGPTPPCPTCTPTPPPTPSPPPTPTPTPCPTCPTPTPTPGSPTCNMDGICQATETIYSCPSDCSCLVATTLAADATEPANDSPAGAVPTDAILTLDRSNDQDWIVISGVDNQPFAIEVVASQPNSLQVEVRATNKDAASVTSVADLSDVMCSTLISSDPNRPCHLMLCIGDPTSTCIYPNIFANTVYLRISAIGVFQPVQYPVKRLQGTCRG